MRKAFTLIELLIVIFITLLLLSILSSIYSGLFKKTSKQVTEYSHNFLDPVVLNILKQDIQNAGLGLGENAICICTNFICKDICLPIDYDKAKGGLVIRSVYNTTNQESRNYGIVSCNSTTSKPVLIFGNRTGSPVVYLDTSKHIIQGENGSLDKCPAPGNLLFFSYDKDVKTSGCINQFCNLIEYYLSTSSSDTLPFCAEGTHTLERRVGGNSTPFIPCVADFKIRFNWEGKLVDPADLSNISLSEEKKKLKYVNVYLLVQASKRESNEVTSNATYSIDNLTLSLSNVTDYSHYKWKLFKLSVKPVNLE